MTAAEEAEAVVRSFMEVQPSSPLGRRGPGTTVTLWEAAEDPPRAVRVEPVMAGVLMASQVHRRPEEMELPRSWTATVAVAVEADILAAVGAALKIRARAPIPEA